MFDHPSCVLETSWAQEVRALVQMTAGESDHDRLGDINLVIGISKGNLQLRSRTRRQKAVSPVAARSSVGKPKSMTHPAKSASVPGALLHRHVATLKPYCARSRCVEATVLVSETEEDLGDSPCENSSSRGPQKIRCSGTNNSEHANSRCKTDPWLQEVKSNCIRETHEAMTEQSPEGLSGPDTTGARQMWIGFGCVRSLEAVS